MDVQKAREYFPYLKKDKIYFNHASTGPLSTVVLERLNKLFHERSEGSIDYYSELIKIIGENKNNLAELINSTSDRIAFLDNTSNGINVLAQSINWKEGDRILLNDIEFPANVYPFLNLEKQGVIIDFVKSKNGKVLTEDILSMIKPETRLVSISQVQFLTGYRADLKEIGNYCKDKNIIFSVDSIQGLGAINVDVQNENIDFISCGTQKWLLGLQGLSFIYVSQKLQEQMDQKNVGWLSVEDAWNLLEFNLKLKSSADRYQVGTLNETGLWALNGSLKLFKEFGWKNIENTVLDNSKYFIDKLIDNNIEPILSGCEKKNIAGIVSIKSESAQKIFDKLAEKNISLAVREGVLRFSPHFYNTKEEINKVVEELKTLF